MTNPIKQLSKKEWGLWLGSLCVILASNLVTGDFDVLTLSAACIGVTSLIFAAVGNVWAQILMVAFSILYGIISYRFRYWGEMMTYLGMSLPMAVWSAVTWLRNPSAEDGSTVQIQALQRKHLIGLAIGGIAVTAIFYVLLKLLDTPNLLFSTISITTSFLAAALAMLRSSYYAAGYAVNDVILIVLWVLAALENPAYIPVVVNFCVFFLNDVYGFLSWKRRELRQVG